MFKIDFSSVAVIKVIVMRAMKVSNTITKNDYTTDYNN